MAIVISDIFSGGTVPSLRINLCVSTPRSCSTSTLDSFAKPLALLGSILMCHRFPLYQSFQSVRGATSLMGSIPIALELITTAGLVFLISLPIVGSKLTNQFSPLLGSFFLVINDISSHQFPPLSRILIVFGYFLGLGSQNRLSLC